MRRVARRHGVLLCYLGCAIALTLTRSSRGDDSFTHSPQQAAAALRRAVSFFHQSVSSHGGYVYRYSADLSKREGEGKTGPDTVWVQPPGTPAVGLALLDAFERTGASACLEAAKSAADCLIRGQLRSGGWAASIEFASQERSRFSYRVDPPTKRGFNWSTLDDDKTQAAIRFLVRLDKTLAFKEARVHEAAQFALESVLKAQFPNGGWPQGWREFPEPSRHPIKPAELPASWPRECPGGDYWLFYTFNDNAIADLIETLLLAAHVYSEPRYQAAALRGGDFIRLAQLPEPQPAWAQQYDFDMHPAWARKFEPPAVSGGESQGLVRILLRLYFETGDGRFLEPIPTALDYLRCAQLPDGRLARFYELKTNRPLYFTREYELTYDDGDLPTHYGFKVDSAIEKLSRQYALYKGLSADERGRRRLALYELDARTPSDHEVRRAIDSLDERGAWVEDGRLSYHGRIDDTRRIISSATFIRNLDVLGRYVRCTRK